MSDWIPMTTREMTEDEKEYYKDRIDCGDEAVIFDCKLPDDGEEVLITVAGETMMDTFLRDEVDGCYFETYDIEDVDAWMSKPEPYKKESEE